MSWWCNIELPGRCHASFSHLQRCLLTRVSRLKGEAQSKCPGNGTREEAKGRRRNNCWYSDAIQDAALNEHLAGIYQPRDRHFQGVQSQLQLSEDPLDGSLGRTDLSIQTLASAFWRGAWSSTWNEPQGRLERLQSQSEPPAARIHYSASHSLLRNQRAEFPSPCSASREQRCHLQSPPFRSWSGCTPELPVICEARIHGTPKMPWWKASWHYDQRLQSITRQYAKHNAPRNNVHRHTGVYQA